MSRPGGDACGAVSQPVGRPSRRALGLCCVALVVAATLLWVASALPWWRVIAQVPLRGPVPVVFTGGQAWPGLLGIAPVALAAVAGVPALAGWSRRLLGGLLAVLGGWVAVAGVAAVLGSTPEPGAPGYPAPPPGVPIGALRDQPVSVAAAPWVALAGAAALLAAGSWMVVRERDLPRLGARFRVGHDRRAVEQRPTDQGRDWWGQLDSGRDPTAGNDLGPPPAAADPRPPG